VRPALVALLSLSLAVACGGGGSNGGGSPGDDGGQPSDAGAGDGGGNGDGAVGADATGDDAGPPPGSSSGVATLFTDVDSGPNTGGPGNLGIPISIFGHGFGASRGTSKVTIGGAEVADYLVWGSHNAHNKDLDEIVVQPGPGVAGGAIVVTVGGASSNADQSFTVRAGAFYAVATTGSDGAACSLTAPCATVSHVASGLMQAGDTLLVHGGTYAGDTVWIRADHGESGAAGKQKVIKVYPGEEASETQLSDNFLVDADYITVSGLTFPDGASLDLVGWANPQQQGDRLVDDAMRGNIGYDAIGSTGNDHVIAGNDCELQGSAQGTEGHCFYIERGSGIQILHNVAMGEGGYGIHIHEEVRATPDVQRIISNVLVEGNIVTASPQRSGIIVQVDDCGGSDGKCYGNAADGIRIINNLLYANNFAGVVLNGIGTNFEVRNNTFYQNGTTGIVIGGTSAAQLSGVDVENNLVYQSQNGNCTSNCNWFPQAHVQIDAAVKMVTVKNNYYGPGAAAFADGNQNPLANPDPATVSGTVQFVNAAGFDFHLHAGDAVIDKGVTLSDVLRDFDGTQRPQGPAYDVGAYEFRP
jgi:hypothetical protein